MHDLLCDAKHWERQNKISDFNMHHRSLVYSKGKGLWLTIVDPRLISLEGFFLQKRVIHLTDGKMLNGGGKVAPSSK